MSRSYSIAQASLRLARILLPQPPKQALQAGAAMPDSEWLFSLFLEPTCCLNVVLSVTCLLFFCHGTGVGGHGVFFSSSIITYTSASPS